MASESETARAARLHVVHGNRLLRECLATVLTRNREFDVREVNPDEADFLEIIISGAPDVILIDGNLPRTNGLDVVRQLRQRLEGAKVLVLFSAPDEVKAAEYIMAGAHGCVVEDSSLEELRAAIRRVVEGRAVCSADMIHLLYTQFAKLARESHWREQVAAIELTARELEILNLISCHLGNKQIAKRLCVSTYTVKNHVHNILEKLQVQSRVEAVEYARQRQWLPEASSDPQ